MGPVPNSWQGERVGAGPPPLRTDAGWLLFYHGNEYLRMPGNKRLYSMGLAVLDLDAPERVLYRHLDPIFLPEAPYEVEGPVGNVVFGTGLAELHGRIYLYYGAGDGVIGMAGWIAMHSSNSWRKACRNVFGLDELDKRAYSVEWTALARRLDGLWPHHHCWRKAWRRSRQPAP